MATRSSREPAEVCSDIATGVTIVLGSIAGLAVAIIAISAPLIQLSWGITPPALLPVISICSTIAATVGPWAITAAEIALVLNALATKTAEQSRPRARSGHGGVPR
jgi:hypothetical protein